MSVQGITILGSTGSIGVNTLDVISRHPDSFKVIALAANSQVERLFAQCQQFRPAYAVMADETAATQLAERIRQAGMPIEVLAGIEGLVTVSQLDNVDQIMAAIVGAAGLLPTLAAAKAGKRVLLANKEALVMSGHLFMEAVKQNQAELLPIDSEHNAIFHGRNGRFGVVAGARCQNTKVGPVRLARENIVRVEDPPHVALRFVGLRRARVPV